MVPGSVDPANLHVSNLKMQKSGNYTATIINANGATEDVSGHITMRGDQSENTCVIKGEGKEDR
jgi:hypothetical protein